MSIFLKSIITFVVGIITIILGFVILKKNSKNPANISYFFLCLFGGAWGLVMAIQLIVFNIFIQEIFITKLMYIFGSLAPLSYLLFAYYYPYKIRNYQKFISWIIYAIPVIFMILIIGGVLKIQNINIINNTVNANVIYFDFLIFSIIYFVYVLAGVVVLIEKYFKISGVYKTKLLFIIFSTFVTFLSVGFVSVILFLFNNTQYDWLGPIFLLFHFFVTWYIIFYKSKKLT